MVVASPASRPGVVAVPPAPAAGSRSTVLTGVSRGLGAALFDELNAVGDRILAVGRRFTKRQREAQRRDPDRVRLWRTDLRDPSTLPDAVALGAWSEGASHLALVHNAAVIEPFGAIGALPADELVTAVAVNLVAPMLLTNGLLAAELFSAVAPVPAGPAAQAGRRLTVLFMSSSAAHRVSGGRSVYSATKRGAETFFEALAAQHAGDERIRVVTVDPGIMDTPMQAALRRYARSDTYFPDRERFLTRYERGELPPAGGVARRIVARYLR